MKLSNIRGIIIFIAALLTGIITVALNLGTLTTAIGDNFTMGIITHRLISAIQLGLW